MPYLHLDLPIAVSVEARAEVAGRLAALYADVMQTNPERVTVALRELGENGVLRNGPDGVEPVVVVQCDIRRGRPPEQRLRLGEGLARVLEDALGWPPHRLVVEFTQHAGDEFWRRDGLGEDWTPAEDLRGGAEAGGRCPCRTARSTRRSCRASPACGRSCACRTSRTS